MSIIEDSNTPSPSSLAGAGAGAGGGLGGAIDSWPIFSRISGYVKENPFLIIILAFIIGIAMAPLFDLWQKYYYNNKWIQEYIDWVTPSSSKKSIKARLEKNQKRNNNNDNIGNENDNNKNKNNKTTTSVVDTKNSDKSSVNNSSSSSSSSSSKGERRSKTEKNKKS